MYIIDQAVIIPAMSTNNWNMFLKNLQDAVLQEKANSQGLKCVD